MTDYSAPLADMRFVLENIVDLHALSSLSGFEHAEPEMVHGILEESGRFFAQEFGPLNRVGDTQHSRRNADGTVTTPDGFRRAYERYVAAGWAGVPFPADYGGGGFPWLVAIAMQEMLTASNMGFSLCPLLTQGAIDMLLHYGSEEQREVYLPKMVTGEWTGTMNLTEPQAGSDVGALTTKAAPADDGSWRITGQKIFITYGEHDLADNIVHLVLARVPDAPPGTKGISCFIVPKYLVNEDGSLGERNSLECVSIEQKMGINASPTCVMAYDGAVGFLIGEANEGMRYMFKMMNNAARVGGRVGPVARRAGLPGCGRLCPRAAPGAGARRPQGRAVADRRPPRRAAHAADHAGADRGAPVPRLPQRREHGPGGTPPRRSRAHLARRARGPVDPDDQGLGHRRGGRAHLDRPAGARRDGLHRGDGGGPALPGHPHRPRLRGDERHPGHGPRRPEAADAGRGRGGRLPRGHRGHGGGAVRGRQRTRRRSASTSPTRTPR